MWTAKEIADHQEAAARLTAIMRDAFVWLGSHPDATEMNTHDFLRAEIRRRGLVMDRPFATPMVAFNAHAADPHYAPKRGGKPLKPGTLIMIDIWARLRGTHKAYADITWMGYAGADIPRAVQRGFDTVIAARDACLASIRRAARRGGPLPTGVAANETANEILRRAGYASRIKHSTGHALGFVSPHGRGRHLNRKNHHPLLQNLPYTIEPGIYVDGKFGIRSEMNFYIARSGATVVTTPLQRKLVRIGRTAAGVVY